MNLTERNQIMKKMVEEAGCTLTQTAKVFGISRERARQIVPYNGNGRRPILDLELESDYQNVMSALDAGEYRSWEAVGRKVGLLAGRIRKVLFAKIGEEKYWELSGRLKGDRARSIVREFLDLHPDALLTFGNLSRVVGMGNATYVSRYQAMSKWRKENGQPEHLMGGMKRVFDGLTVLREQ